MGKSLFISGYTLVEVLAVILVCMALTVGVVSVGSIARRRAVDATCIASSHQIGLALSAYMNDFDGAFPSAVSSRFDNYRTSSDQTWRDKLLPYLHSGSFSECPLADSRMRDGHWGSARSIDLCGYAMNQRLNAMVGVHRHGTTLGRNEAAVRNPSLSVAVFDARPGILSLRGPDSARNQADLHGIWESDLTDEILSMSPGDARHNGGAIYLFLDWHSKWLEPTAFAPRAPGSTEGPTFDP